MQDLSQFKLPKNFRGRNAIWVQIWWVVQSMLFGTSLQFMYGWRRFLLRLFGAEIGKNVIIRPSVKVTYPWKLSVGDNSWIGDDVVLYTLGTIKIGKNSVVSQRSYLCTGSHDYSQITFPIFEKSIKIEDEVWIATDVYIGPGVEICSGSVVGARSSVFKNIEKKGVYVGSPVRYVKTRD
ncbi:putative colanic acid biosynthesis acetyltransferase [Sediminitomix flava]|uniref:Putative colanic acid biosynthesis acetyltransferase WcaF n=1 Tax=Sediminitomix flava TaxID=379075 RepID=A0A315ZW78_SEDFL|nr:putative colanic acid biosynthesis acetyltransferase [Sediminitomix flava]PWJ40933.1 putative colanic acid biosynthesis acetyltransferase WcaF [Sediminitomix flava]